MGDPFRDELEDHLRVLRETVETQGAVLHAISDLLVAAFRAGGRLLVCGNGGSAADSQHIAAEFVNRLRFDRAALPALALTVDGSVLTCIGNDSSFDFVFSRQVEALARPGDVLLGISTSGRSRNVLEALRVARAAGVRTVGFTSRPGVVHMGPLCDLCLAVQSADTARIQEGHEFSFHSIVARVERVLFRPETASTEAA